MREYDSHLASFFIKKRILLRVKNRVPVGVMDIILYT